MLYLLKSPGFDRVIYKIGFAENLEKRFSTYQAHNPFIEKLSEKQGTLEDECLLHKYLHTFSDLEFYKSEWYLGNEELISQRFSDSEENIRKRVWENRNIPGLFCKTSEMDQRIYSELYDYSNITSGDIEFNPELIKEIQPEILDLNQYFIDNREFSRRMCFYCQFRDQNPDLALEILGSITVPIRYHEYYDKYGTAKMRTVGYRESEFKNLFAGELQELELIKNSILNTFIIGERYSTKFIKSELQRIYSMLGLSKTAKATDLLGYIECKDTIFQDNGKMVRGLKLLSLKQ